MCSNKLAGHPHSPLDCHITVGRDGGRRKNPSASEILLGSPSPPGNELTRHKEVLINWIIRNLIPYRDHGSVARNGKVAGTLRVGIGYGESFRTAPARPWCIYPCHNRVGKGQGNLL